jgi:hypothetical protein
VGVSLGRVKDLERVRGGLAGGVVLGLSGGLFIGLWIGLGLGLDLSPNFGGELDL